MSMSTPLNNLPLKTQQNNNDVSDINDPMVQDVLNEFQEELMMSKKSHEPSLQPIPQMQYPSVSQPILNIQQPIHNYPQPPVNKYNINYNNVSFPYNYIDMDLIKKTLAIVIITVLLFYTDVLHIIYEKLPPYAYDTAMLFDVYVKAVVLFSILYILGFLHYI